jgi:hypothetical protein
MKYLLILISAMLCLVSTTLHTQSEFADNYSIHDKNMDSICNNFVVWQKNMAKDGYPPALYEKTGMEIYCPLMR